MAIAADAFGCKRVESRQNLPLSIMAVRQMMNRFVVFAVFQCSFAAPLIASAVEPADEPSAEELHALLKEGGKHWSVSEEGFTGFKKYEAPGEAIAIWPTKDIVHPVVVFADGSGSANIDFHWQLQPGQQFPDKFPEYLTYQWGEPDGKAYGFNVTKDIDPRSKSGQVSARLAFHKGTLEKLRGEQEVVVALFHDGESLGNFVRVNLAFPAK